MLRASVPEAPIDKDSNLLPREHDVRADPDVAGTDSEILPEPVTRPVEQRSHLDFRFRVRALIRPHVVRDRDARCWRRDEDRLHPASMVRRAGPGNQRDHARSVPVQVL
jgi:hypothetical protein